MADTINYRFVMRRALAATWAALNDVLLEGEYGFEKDTKKVKIGDGVTPWNDLDYMTTGGGAGVTIDDVPPPSPTPGQEWVDANTGIKYTWYEDGDSNQWVEFGPDTPMYLMPVYPEGSSFPGSPANGDKFYRTDLNLLCYYDSTLGVWLTVSLFTTHGFATALPPSNATGITAYMAKPPEAIYVERVFASMRNSGTNNPSNYWVFTFLSTGASGNTTLPGSISTQYVTFTSPTFLSFEAAIGSLLTDSELLSVNAAKTGAPGNYYPLFTFEYRRVIT